MTSVNAADTVSEIEITMKQKQKQLKIIELILSRKRRNFETLLLRTVNKKQYVEHRFDYCLCSKIIAIFSDNAVDTTCLQNLTVNVADGNDSYN